MTTTTATDTVACHRERSWHFLDPVDDELARGELKEAGSKVWPAAGGYPLWQEYRRRNRLHAGKFGLTNRPNRPPRRPLPPQGRNVIAAVAPAPSVAVAATAPAPAGSPV